MTPTGTMIRRSLLVCGLVGALALGCSRAPVRPTQAGAPAPIVADAPEAGVPLPAKTPFDGNPRIRAIYLEYYALGYRSANAEYASPGCMCVAEGDAERYDAAWSGFFDGKEAGSAAAGRRSKSRAPSPAAPR